MSAASYVVFGKMKINLSPPNNEMNVAIVSVLEEPLPDSINTTILLRRIPSLFIYF